MPETGESNNYYELEARELLQAVEQNLMQLEETPGDRDLLDEIFRSFHTIKGSGSMFGYTAVADFTHEVESLFDLMREGRLTADHEIINAALAAKDYTLELISDEETSSQRGEELKRVMRSFREHIREEEETPSEPQQDGSGDPGRERLENSPAAEAGDRIYRIIFKPAAELFLRGAKVLPLIRELRAMGRCAVFGHTGDIPDLQQLDPEQCRSSWTILLSTDRGRNAIEDVFMFVEDYSELHIDVIDEENRVDVDAEYKRIGEILCERGDITREDIQRIVDSKIRFGDVAMEEGLLSSDTLNSALEEQKFVRQARKKRRERQSSSTIRVSSGKLDHLVDLVGELVTLQARLSQYSQHSRSDSVHERNELELVNETLERLTTNLRDTTMNIRMVPLAETFNSFQRLVRDLSAELGKEVRLETTGAETELDKHIIDALGDPLVHVIRNAVDHGFEPPGEREQQGKRRQGTLAIDAEHYGGQVVITIVDDGRGIDVQQIRDKAVNRGLIQREEQLGDEELLNLLFHPGFSTAESTTSVSGRGVGMDVVKREIEKLRGKVKISSEKGRGSTIHLTIPLTLSIIDGLLVALAEERYVVNLSVVEECFELTNDLRGMLRSQEYLTIRGEVVPYIDLRELFGLPEKEQGVRELTVVRSGDQKVAVIVDHIIGQHQTVVKPLSRAFSGVEEISGSTILGDGSIAFILDTNKMMERAVG
jgi:two-component system chemotaxis sensor kinase CheA